MEAILLGWRPRCEDRSASIRPPRCCELHCRVGIARHSRLGGPSRISGDTSRTGGSHNCVYRRSRVRIASRQGRYVCGNNDNMVCRPARTAIVLEQLVAETNGSHPHRVGASCGGVWFAAGNHPCRIGAVVCRRVNGCVAVAGYPKLCSGECRNRSDCWASGVHALGC